MSVRTELEELAKWISELTAKHEPAPPQPLPREAWQAITRDLERASTKFAETSAALCANDSKSTLAEFAGDLQREAEGLALRAHLLSRRAAPKHKPEHPAPKPVEKEAETAAAATAEKATGELPAAETAADHEHAPAPRKAAPDDDHPVHREPTAAELAKSAADTVETAHNKLDAVEHPDDVSKDFEAELDVLAEMALSLRRQCEQLPHAPKGAG